MIFNVPGHIEMIRNGLYCIDHQLYYIQDYPAPIVKTQTRRTKRGYYQLESERKKPHEIGYAVQRKRGAKAEPDIRIIMDRIWEDFDFISVENAQAEGGYSPTHFEEVFAKLNPRWKGGSRWAFEFHVKEVQE